jgi:hypothetical protein
MAELLADWCEWASGAPSQSGASTALRSLSRTLMTAQFRLARVAGGGTWDFAGALRECAQHWAVAAEGIAAICESSTTPDRRPPAIGFPASGRSAPAAR